MTLKAQSANPTSAETDDGLDETYYTDLLKMKLDNAVWVELQHCLHILFFMFFFVEVTWLHSINFEYVWF